MPVVVLHAEDATDEDRVVGLVEELFAGHDAHGSRCAVAPAEREGPTEVRRAAGLVRDLGDPKRWDGRRALYRRYSFPRLRLVRAIEDAVGELDPDWPGPPSGTGTAQGLADPAQTLLDQLARQRWRPKGSHRWSARLNLFDMAHILPASLVAVLAALLARTDWSIALASGAGFLVLLMLLDNILPGRAPIFLWLRRESRWFMTTTFLRAASPGRPTEVSLLRPVRSWNAIAARAHDVAEALKTGDDFQLQLYVLALCEDLRDSHRRWSWDLRGFKRTRPPVLLLPRASAANGGIELIKAVSDVRSRRSELDPLLIVASVSLTDVTRLQRSVISQPGTAPWTWYQEWGRNLRAGQSPSRALAELPWVIKVPLPSDRLVPSADGQRHCAKALSRPSAARLVWSLHTLVLVTALLATGVGLRAADLDERYCSASLLTANKDTVRVEEGPDPTECIGIATGGVRFSDWLADGGKAPRREQVPWTVRALEQSISAENRKVVEEHPGNYVTVVYLGPLSASTGERTSPVKGIEELAGVYLAQAAINDTSTVQLRVLVANGGVDMRHQVRAAEAVAEYAADDPTVVGVIGAGRDLRSSRDTARVLRDAELPVVSGTNSATYLPREFANWFSLAATDEWQAEQLGLIAGQLRTPGSRQYALVLARDTKRTHDLYTDEQAKYGEEMLRQQGYTLLGQRRYAVTSGRPGLEVHTEEFCRGRVPSVIYFAGRVEDVPPLMTQLNTEEGCASRDISVLTGDDLSKANFSADGQGVTSGVTLYHAALAKLSSERRTLFYRNAARYLSELGMVRPHSSANPALRSGQTALAHDATQALHKAASRSGQPQSRAATWVNMRTVRLWGMATGTIDFTGARPYADREGHSIVLNEVRGAADGSPRLTEVCARSAGDARPLTAAHCALPGAR